MRGEALVLTVFFLNRVEHLESILESYLEVGVTGATIVGSVGMGRILAYEVPIFAGLREAFPGSNPSNKIILAAVERALVAEMIPLIEEVIGPLSDPGNGVFLTLPIEQGFGLGRGL